MKIFSNYINVERYEHYFLPLERFKDAPISIFNDYKPTLEELSLNPINILLIMEPNEFFGLHDYAIQNQHKFNLILTWGDKILQEVKHSRLFPYGEAWVDIPYTEKFNSEDREFEVTFLCGSKNLTEGHRLRQEIYKNQDKITIPKHFWYTLPDYNQQTNQRPGYFAVDGSFVSKNGTCVGGEGKKIVWDRNSMFHVSIENIKHDNYFTEKLIDCFITKTLPLYWGCPNIDSYFDIRGIIEIPSNDRLFKTINNLTPEDYYSRKEAIENNYETALKYASFFKRIEDVLEKVLQMNNL